MKSPRELQDEISESLLLHANYLDSQAGSSEQSAALRSQLRGLAAEITRLCELLNLEIPAPKAGAPKIFAVEIRQQILEVQNYLIQLPQVSNLELKQAIDQISVEVNFPKYFLELSKSKTLTIEPLTKREREVLALLPRGLTSKAMASELFLTEATIKTHLTSIYRKFEVENRVQAITIALDLKLLTF